MKKRTSFLFLSCIFVLGIGAVFILFLYSSEKPNHKFNSFLRLFPENPLKSKKTLDIKYNSYYIAGATRESIYFGNIQATRHIIRTNINLSDTQHIALDIEGLDELKFSSITVHIDSPYFYFADGSTPAIFKGSIKNWRAQRYMYDSVYFMESIPINKTSFAIRSISSSSGEITLGKVTNNPPYVKLAPNLLEKQIDGKFCKDGTLHYNRGLGWLIYVYRYRNQFICTDTTLNLLYKGNTIDTVSWAKIKVTEIESDKSITMAVPPIIVNRSSCVSGKWLFINSNLLAKNEDKNSFENSSVIDIYNLKDGQYQFSFYIPLHNNKKMREFKVFDTTLIALYDHYAIKYQLDLSYFSNKTTTITTLDDASSNIQKKLFN